MLNHLSYEEQQETLRKGKRKTRLSVCFALVPCAIHFDCTLHRWFPIGDRPKTGKFVNAVIRLLLTLLTVIEETIVRLHHIMKPCQSPSSPL